MNRASESPLVTFCPQHFCFGWGPASVPKAEADKDRHDQGKAERGDRPPEHDLADR